MDALCRYRGVLIRLRIAKTPLVCIWANKLDGREPVEISYHDAQMKKPPNSGAKFRLQKTMSIGALDAEHDRRYLETAFLETSVLPVLQDTDDRRSIVVGRTGVGKTALLLRMEQVETQVVRIRPDAFSLKFLSNSTILPYLSQLGVHLNLFYKWLWRHVITTEIINAWAKREGELKRNAFQDFIRSKVQPKRSQGRRALMNYRERFASSFWEHTDERVKELVDTLEKNLEGELGAELQGIFKARVGASGAVTRSTTSEVIYRTQQIVNDTQIHELDDILGYVQEHVLADAQKPFYVVIDDLDKEWVDDRYAYELTDALLEEAGEFAKMENVKVIVALRDNIVEQLHSHQRDKRGRQREKHEDLMIRIRWDEHQLVQLANLRLEQMVRKQYSGKITLGELLPSGGKNKISGVQYVLDRTFLRPRDLIAFINTCIAQSKEGTAIDWKTVHAAERIYSAQRLVSLEDEWKENYPGIGTVLRVLRGMNDGFIPEDLDYERLMPVLIEGEDDPEANTFPGEIHKLVEIQSVPLETVVRDRIIPVLFQVGVIGVKLTGAHPIEFSYTIPDLLRNGLHSDSYLYFHPSLYLSLDVVQQQTRG